MLYARHPRIKRAHQKPLWVSQEGSRRSSRAQKNVDTAWLQHEQRVSYRALKRQFALDGDYLEDLKDELIYAKKLAVDEAGRVLVWTGATNAPPVPEPAIPIDQPSHVATPSAEPLSVSHQQRPVPGDRAP